MKTGKVLCLKACLREHICIYSHTITLYTLNSSIRFLIGLLENEKPRCITWAHKMLCSCAESSDKLHTNPIQCFVILRAEFRRLWDLGYTCLQAHLGKTSNAPGHNHTHTQGGWVAANMGNSEKNPTSCSHLSELPQFLLIALFSGFLHLKNY